jgi:Uma2 family endonuclease
VRFISPQELTPNAPEPISRAEYDRRILLGEYEGDRIELLYGQLVLKERQTPAHAHFVTSLNSRLLLALGDRAAVQAHGPIAASDVSEPEPDVAVIPPGDYLDEHPRVCHLLIEVADGSRDLDLGLKARLYAEMGVLDYWVVDLQHHAVVVHRAPVGGHYDDVRTLTRGAEIALLAFPDVTVRADDMLRPA